MQTLTHTTTIAHDFLQTHFPGIHMALLTGSAATGTLKPHSDLDILILSPYCNTPYLEKYHFQGQAIEAIVLPEHRILDLLLRAVRNGNAAYLRMLQDSHLLLDHHDRLANLKIYATQLYQQGNTMLSLYQHKMQLITLGNLVDDLEDDRPHDEHLFIVQAIMNEFVRLTLTYHLRWTGKAKIGARHLREFDPHLHQVFVTALDEFFEYHDRSPLVLLMRSELQKYGGQLIEYSTRVQHPAIVNQGRIAAAITGDLDRLALMHNVILPLLARTDIAAHCKRFYFYHHETLGYKTLLCLRGDHEAMRDKVFPLLDQALLKLPANGPQAPELTYPDWADIPDHYGETDTRDAWEELMTSAAHVLSQITQRLDQPYDAPQAINFGLFLLLAFTRAFFPQRTDRQHFLQHLLSRWLPRAYDTDNKLSHMQLINAASQTLEDFATRYRREPEAYDLHREIYLDYDSAEIDDAWFQDWLTALAQLQIRLQTLALEGNLHAFHYETLAVPSHFPAQDKAKIVFLEKAIFKVLNQTGVYLNHTAFLPWLLLHFDPLPQPTPA